MKQKLSIFLVIALAIGIAGLLISILAKNNLKEQQKNNKQHFGIKRYVATEVWIKEFPNPLELEQNDTVDIVLKDINNPIWKGWVFCMTANNYGYVPIQIIDSIGENKGLITERYSAKDISIKKGEKVIALKELNGLAWVKKESDGEEGWLPLDILTEISIDNLESNQ